ncbi:PQQ-dependent sugar dehydrogenase [Halosolutus gelatinilyticus]|uniref:PQQ-dependent sugar dehydrogenase n=1 Tax=Halosolutus gelatinilyticus TaxID=2931975 RepID=UPI001FF33DAF|nr:PQQ-dependent sugar dehydrogenase [Halosolutus gelatinilyticus]
MTPSDRDQTTTRRALLASGAAGTLATIAGCQDALAGIQGEQEWERPPDDEDQYEVETVAEGLTHPWGLAFVPDGDRLLVTEREGRLLTVDLETGDRQPVDKVPDVYARGQGGLLDVALHPDYPEEDWVYLTYAAETDGGESTTHLGRGRLDPDGDELEEFEELRAARPTAEGDAHFGSRIVFGPDELLYMTVGDRQFKDFGPGHTAQDTRTELGAVLRLEPDGSIPADNPFVDDSDAIDSLFSFGHRNPQGLAVRPETGDVWESEHGEGDGDEINVLEAGENYGWPVATSACEYGTDEPVGDDPDDRDDVIAPVYDWPCSTGGFPPGGIAFYDGDAFADWQGDLLVCNLAAGYLCRFAVDGTDIEAVGTMLTAEGWRLRDVAIAPESGAIYVAVDEDDAPLVRLVPDAA